MFRFFLDDLLNQTVLFGYDRNGFNLRKKLWNPADTSVSLSGIKCLITGATSGIGKATAMALIERGATVILAGRNSEKAEVVRKEILDRYDAAERLYIEIADLSLLSGMKSLTDSIKHKFTSLQVLINNAGVLLNEREETDECIEKTFATNLLAYHALIKELHPLLQPACANEEANSEKTFFPRIINVTSGGMYLSTINIDDIEFKNRPYNGVSAYAETKRGEVILTEYWAEMLKGRVAVNCMHPGWAETASVQTSLPAFYRTMKYVLRTPAQGADTIVWMTCKPWPANETGRLYFDRKERAKIRFGIGNVSEEQKNRLIALLDSFL